MAKRRRPPAKARKTREKLDEKARAGPRTLPPPRYPWRTRGIVWLLLIMGTVLLAIAVGL